MTNGEKFREIFSISQVDEGVSDVYVWTHNHDATVISIDWWNAEYKEPRKGHWLAKSFHEVYCDNCGFDFDIMTNEFIDKMKYCPNCGARMIKPQESEVEK